MKKHGYFALFIRLSFSFVFLSCFLAILTFFCTNDKVAIRLLAKDLEIFRIALSSLEIGFDWTFLTGIKIGFKIRLEFLEIL